METDVVILRAHANGSIFADHREGRKPCLMGLHGWGRKRSDLGLILDASGHRSVAPDLPGFGASTDPGSAWGAVQYATVLAERVAPNCDPPFVVVGHSFGGRVAACLAANYPDLVCGLVLMGVPLIRQNAPERSSKRYRLIRAAARLGFISPKHLEVARQRFGSEDYRAANGVMRDVLVRVVNESYHDELERVRCPVALVWGGDDQVVPSQVAERAAEHIQQLVSLNIVDGVGHDVHLAVPETVVKAVSTVVAASK